MYPTGSSGQACQRSAANSRNPVTKNPIVMCTNGRCALAVKWPELKSVKALPTSRLGMYSAPKKFRAGLTSTVPGVGYVYWQYNVDHAATTQPSTSDQA